MKEYIERQAALDAVQEHFCDSARILGAVADLPTVAIRGRKIVTKPSEKKICVTEVRNTNASLRYLLLRWILWRIDRALEQAEEEARKARYAEDMVAFHAKCDALEELRGELKDGPTRTTRQIFEDYRGPEPREEAETT